MIILKEIFKELERESMREMNNKNIEERDKEIVQIQLNPEKKTTTVVWNDGVTFSKCDEQDEYDSFVGFCIAFTKGIFGSKNQVLKALKEAKVIQPKKKEQQAEKKEK